SFTAGSCSTENLILGDVRTAIIRSFPTEVSSSHIALTRQTGRLRRHRPDCVRVRVITLEQTLAAGLTCDTHESDEIIRAGASDTFCADAAIAVAIENVAFVINGDFVKIE